MMIKVASLFSQLLQQISRTEFAVLIKKHDAEYRAKGFTCWTQLVAMLFCHLAHADSLREICNGLSCCLGKLLHLGIQKAPKKSTLCYANEHRPAVLYEHLFFSMMHSFRQQHCLYRRKATFRFKNKLLSLDSTTISLCLELFPWAKFRRAKGGVKAHVLLDHDDYLPAYVLITQAKTHDIKAARLLMLNPGSIVAMDRAYHDFALFSSWTERGIFFVTRMKENTVYDIVECYALPQNRNIISDDKIMLTGVHADHSCPYALRRIVVWDPQNQRDIVLMTNNFVLGASTIAAIYKDRWEIELFFKALKQNLKIKTFVGTSENALLLIKWLHHLSKAAWSLSNLASMLRLNLFTYRDLMEWLAHPFERPPLIPCPEQLLLPLNHLGQAIIC